MISININIYAIEKLQSKIDSIAKNSTLISKEVANSLLPIIKKRVHQDGVKSDGTQIGIYKNSYLRYRQEQGRNADSKVILSLTGQMENDLTVQPTTDGYGLGYNNPINKKKADGLQFGNKNLKGYGSVFTPTVEEQEIIVKVATNFINNGID